MRDGSLENSLGCNFQEPNYVTDYKLYPPQILKCSLCDNFKTKLLPCGRQEMMEHMEVSHRLTPRKAMQETALIPTMTVVDVNVL